MTFNSWADYLEFQKFVASERRYIFPNNIQLFLAQLVGTSAGRELKIDKGTTFWRSRMGRAKDNKYTDPPEPHSKKEMLPFRDGAPDGRVNPKGINYLYVASDEKTAISESRPWIEADVSLAKIENIKDLKVIDITADSGPFPVWSYEPSDELKETAVWTHLIHAFSRPVDRNEFQAKYAATQVISEVFRDQGYDGVKYGSSAASGTCVAIFDIDTVRVVDTYVCRVSKIDVEFGYIGDNRP